MKRCWVVPCFFLVNANSAEQAESKVEVVRGKTDYADTIMMFDERLTTWAYDADKYDIHSALDKNRCELRVRYVAQGTVDDGTQGPNAVNAPYWVFDTETNNNVAGPLPVLSLAKKIADLLEDQRERL